MHMQSRSHTFAGAAAVCAGLAWIIWVIINISTGGGLDVGPKAVGPGVARLGEILTVAWNLLLLPAVLLVFELGRRERPWMTGVTLCGILSFAFWAYGSATRTLTPSLEATYLVLSAVWWGGFGFFFRRSLPWFGLLTMILGAFSLWDAILTSFEPVPYALYMTASLKLPLSILWDFILGILLLRGKLNIILSDTPPVAHPVAGTQPFSGGH